MMTAILATTTVLALAAAVYFFLRERKLRGSMSNSEEEAKKREASQAQVIHTTKLASLGRMVAGVAHEISTPLRLGKSNEQVVS